MEMRNQGTRMTEVKEMLPLYEMSPGNSRAENGLVDRIAPKPDHCQMDQVDYQAGKSRYGHELVEPGDYA